MSTRRYETRAMTKNFQEIINRVKKTESYDQEVLRGEISDQISGLMTAQGINKAELAKRLKTSRAYITKILQGNANFTLDSLVQIARALGCKYMPIFVPSNEWKQVAILELSASSKEAASPSQTYTAPASVEATSEINANRIRQSST